MFRTSSHMRGALIALFFIGAALFAASTAIAATVTLDGAPVTSVVQHNGRLLIPFRAPMERLGARVNWLNPTAMAHLNGRQLVTVNVGSSRAVIKGTTRTLSVPPELIGGAAYVPVDALTEICAAHGVYSADRTAANVTGCNLAGINAVAARAPAAVAAPAVGTPAAPTARGGARWIWLLVGLAALGALWAWTRSYGERSASMRDRYGGTARSTGPSPNVVRGTVDDYVPRLKDALSQTDDAHRASFVQQLSQTFNENRSTIPDSLVASSDEDFAAATSGAPGPVLALVDRVSGHPQLLQMAAAKFAARYPGELGALDDLSKARM